MIRINLLKPETREVKEGVAAGAPEFKPKKPTNYGNLVFLLLVIGLGAFFFLQKKAFDRETTLLNTARQEKDQLAYVTAKLDELNRQKASLVRKINLIQSLKARQDLAVRIMDDLSRKLPDWVWLTEVTFDSATVQIRGKALSNNLIADYITALEDSPNLMNINLISSTVRRSQKNEYLEFALSATIERKAETPVAAAPQKRRGT